MHCFLFRGFVNCARWNGHNINCTKSSSKEKEMVEHRNNLWFLFTYKTISCSTRKKKLKHLSINKYHFKCNVHTRNVLTFECSEMLFWSSFPFISFGFFFHFFPFVLCHFFFFIFYSLVWESNVMYRGPSIVVRFRKKMCPFLNRVNLFITAE